jgi:hypothetical protein
MMKYIILILLMKCYQEDALFLLIILILWQDEEMFLGKRHIDRSSSVLIIVDIVNLATIAEVITQDST